VHPADVTVVRAEKGGAPNYVDGLGGHVVEDVITTPGSPPGTR
jgi:hypothetical protein